jgi:hypothetical protein
VVDRRLARFHGAPEPIVIIRQVLRRPEVLAASAHEAGAVIRPAAQAKDIKISTHIDPGDLAHEVARLATSRGPEVSATT